MVSVWVVTTAFVVTTFITVKLRGYKKMPHALRMPLPLLRTRPNWPEEQTRLRTQTFGGHVYPSAAVSFCFCVPMNWSRPGRAVDF